MQRGPTQTAPAPAELELPQPLALPTRLEPYQQHALPVAASSPRPLIATQTLTIEVTSKVAPLTAEQREQLGVATFAATTGADFGWTPLREGTLRDDDSVLVQAQVPQQTDLEVTLATSPEQARHGYLVRVLVARSELRTTDVATITLAADIATIAFELPESPLGQSCHGPWRLLRLDDARWLPQQLDSTGLFLSGERATEVLLGRGSYRLQDPLDASRSQDFDVPSADPVVLSAELVAPRADRR